MEDTLSRHILLRVLLLHTGYVGLKMRHKAETLYILPSTNPFELIKAYHTDKGFRMLALSKFIALAAILAIPALAYTAASGIRFTQRDLLEWLEDVDARSLLPALFQNAVISKPHNLKTRELRGEALDEVESRLVRGQFRDALQKFSDTRKTRSIADDWDDAVEARWNAKVRGVVRGALAKLAGAKSPRGCDDWEALEARISDESLDNMDSNI